MKKINFIKNMTKENKIKFMILFSLFFLFLYILFLVLFFNKDNLNKENQTIKTISKIEDNKFFVVISHHNLINSQIDTYYAKIKQDHPNIKNIVIISPNHFYDNLDNSIESFTSDGKYCYKSNWKQTCLKAKKFKDENIFTESKSDIFIKKDWVYDFIEHWIWNHFQFIEKYFKKANLYSIILKINKSNNLDTKRLNDFLLNYQFSWDTLFIASVDFSHHNQEKLAEFHDKKTIEVLNSEQNNPIEVDCPNCLFLEKSLARSSNKSYFELDNRSSSSLFTATNTNFQNTSYVFWEFKNTEKLEEKFIYGMFFWDMHFTRWFTYTSNKLKIDDYLECFYQNKDKTKTPDFWHNRAFYSFDIVWANLETSVALENECQTSNKSIRFRTDPKYLRYFKDIWINTFTIANNHSYDCGNIWYQATKKHLWDLWFTYFWDGRWQESVVSTQVINWQKLAMIWLNNVDLSWKIEDKIEKIKKLKYDWNIVILNIHWWEEYKTIANEKQRKLAREFIDAWVDLIIWHHPHVVQDYEIYNWKAIFYSLWNFIFDQPFPETLLWYGLIFAINDKKIEWKILEFKRDPKTYKIDCDSFK